jgi:hypothetical protein
LFKILIRLNLHQAIIMTNSQKMTSKAIALFLSLGMISSLAGCGIGATGEGEENGENGVETEQPANTSDEDDEGDESGEDGEGNEDD